MGKPCILAVEKIYIKKQKTRIYIYIRVKGNKDKRSSRDGGGHGIKTTNECLNIKLKLRKTKKQIADECHHIK